jgi:hypothetical protein
MFIGFNSLTVGSFRFLFGQDQRHAAVQGGGGYFISATG